MKNEVVTNSCRVCLTKTKKLRSLYKPIDEGDEPPNEMLYLVTGIKVEKLTEHETLPKNICKNCELSLSMAFEFRENALKTQEIVARHLKQLLQYDNNEENKTSMAIFKSEYEEMMNLEPLECVRGMEDIQNISDDQLKYSLENDEELIEAVNSEDISEEKNEQVEDASYNQQGVSCFINDSNENKDEEEITIEKYIDHQENEDCERDDELDHRMSDDQNEVEYTEEQIEIVSAEEENYAFNRTNFIKNKSTKTKKKKISKISTKHEKSKGKQNDINIIENIQIIPRRGRKPSNNTNQNGHICDICGNVFAKRGRMMEHRQRHDKECRFCCEICDQKFFTRELLRKHMFSHSGGKPLKCEFCSRTFYYESVRKAHESVHKGLRPYICDVCGKSFSYAHALKKHKLIHAEIKLYRCEYCNKDFRLQHHMKQHEHTKLHQNAVRFAKSNISFEDCGEMIKGEEDLNEDIIFLEEIAEDQLAEGS